MAVRLSNTSAQAELAEFRKSKTFQGKNTIFIEHPVHPVCKYFARLLHHIEKTTLHEEH